MQGFKGQGSVRPTAMGTLLQSAAYGATVPVIYGLTQSPLLAIWAANLRQGGSTKKFKQMKKGITAYVENIDFLLGHTPIMGVLRIMNNGSMLPLNFVSAEVNTGAGDTNLVLPITAGGVLDPNFYMVLAVTSLGNYDMFVEDYGSSQGLQHLTGSWEVPLWNELEVGPDPTGGSSFRNKALCYRWQPSYGPYIHIDEQPGYGSNVKVYYAQLSAEIARMSPLAKLRLAFEAQLGSGSEYADAGAPYNAQQIIYPHFAGCGSSDLDLGAAGVIPQLQPEVRGKWGVYPSGDCDFVDIIEDIFKSGLAQASLDSAETFTQMERGLSSYNLPGCIQRKTVGSVYWLDGAIPYDLPTTAGNFLLAVGCVGDGYTDTPTISDTAGNTWTPIFPTGNSIQAWYAKAVGGATSVTFGFSFWNVQASIYEIAGVDTFDSVAVGSGGAASLTTANQPGFAEYVLAIALWHSPVHPHNPGIPQWNPLLYFEPQDSTVGGLVNGLYSPYQLLLERTVRAPGVVSIALPGSSPDGIALLAFKATQPSFYPQPLGDFFDFDSHNLVRVQCRANGLWGSLSMNSQSAASEWLKTLYQAANAAPVYLGSKLFAYPYSEVSIPGNGAYYRAPSAAGPVAALDANNGDFVGESGCPKFTSVSRINLPNVLQMQCLDRNANYNQVVVQQPDAASIALYGVRKADAIVNNAIQDPSIARALLGIQVRRNQYGGDTWSFTASPRWALLSPMDLITLTDELQNVLGVPVRITAFNENMQDGSFEGTAEPFVYGMCAPTPLPATTPTINPTLSQVSAGNVNPPIIFEPTPGLYPSLSGDQLWVVVSSGSPNYGGAQVMISTDGGASYNPAGDPLIGSADTGALTAQWPAANDPDTTNDLAVDLSESNGSLASYAVAVEDNFEYPCYVASVGSSEEVNGVAIANGNPMTEQVNGSPIATLNTEKVNSTSIASIMASDGFGYELMAYAVATLTAPNQYTLQATGGGNKLRRSVLLAPSSSGVGVGHAAGARFALLSPAGTGILKLPMPTTYIGQTIYFKILSFNQFGAALQALADVPAYSYVPTGVPGAA